MVKVPMPAFVITVYQVSAYAVDLFRGTMLLLHVLSLFSTYGGPARVVRVLAQQGGTFRSAIDLLPAFSLPIARPVCHDFPRQVAFPFCKEARRTLTLFQCPGVTRLLPFVDKLRKVHPFMSESSRSLPAGIDCDHRCPQSSHYSSGTNFAQ